MSEEKEKPKKSHKDKAVDDVRACTFEGKPLDDCMTEAKKAHDLSDEEADLVKWEAARGKKK